MFPIISYGNEHRDFGEYTKYSEKDHTFEKERKNGCDIGRASAADIGNDISTRSG